MLKNKQAPQGMERFIKRYESTHLIGLDFDIAAGQTAQQAESLILRIKAAQAKRPQLRYSFTLATHAAWDGSRKSLNGEGEAAAPQWRARRHLQPDGDGLWAGRTRQLRARCP